MKVLLSTVKVPTLLLGAPVSVGDSALLQTAAHADGPRHARLWALVLGEAVAARKGGFVTETIRSSSTSSGSSDSSMGFFGIKSANGIVNPLESIVDIPDDEETNPSFQRFGPHFTLRTPASPMPDQNAGETCASLVNMISSRLRAFVAASKSKD